MALSRRALLQAMGGSLAATSVHSGAAAMQPAGAPRIGGSLGFKRIATEEAWAPPDLIQTYIRMASAKSIDDAGFNTMWSRLGSRTQLIQRLTDIDAVRLSDMDAAGIDVQILSLTSPGLQVFDAPTANSLAVATNDTLAETIRKHPTRFAGLAAAAPQDPPAAAREIERAVTRLGLKGVIINSHTHGELLDDPKFWDIFEAAEALDVPIYLHPQTPPPAMAEPFVSRGLESAVWGFGAECGLHALAIIRSGAFDRFPRLNMILGHAGEALPFWLYRIDYMSRTAPANLRNGAARLRHPPSYYLKNNFYVTTSGVAWGPVIAFLQSVLGVERVLYAMDYPYQFDVAEVVTTDTLPMPPADKRRLYQSNAEALFRL